MSLFSKIRSSLSTAGVLATIRKAFRWARIVGTRPFRRWLKKRRRRRGRPVGPKPIPLKKWLKVYGEVRPDPAPDTTRLITVVCPVYDTEPAMLEAAVGSVRAQTYPNWELILIDDASPSSQTRDTVARLTAEDDRVRSLRNDENSGIAVTTNRGIEEARGEYVVFLDHDDELAPTALEWCATCAPRADVVYSDEYKIDAKGNPGAPFFKPSWSPRLLTGVNYMNHLTAVRTDLLRRVGGLRTGFDGAQDHDLALRISELDPDVAHLPNLLYRWRAWAGSVAGIGSAKVGAEEAGLKSLQDAIDRRGWNARAGIGSGSPFNYRVLWEAAEQPPTVKVVIPTRNKWRLLRRSVDGVLNRSDGADVHLVVVDNGSRQERVLRYLETLGAREDVTVVTHDDAFNYSTLVNVGAAAGPDCDFIALVNNDIEIPHRRWLQQMLGWFEDDQVVGVGTKLRFPDRTIQHAGVVIGMGGIAGHYSLGASEIPRLGNLHDQVREVGCLTAACLVIRSSAFERLGGFNEDLPIDFQDVEFCLRLRHDLGGTLVYDPTFPLIHDQGATRGTKGAANPYTITRMRFLWGDEIAAGDPYYNPHLTLEDHSLGIGRIPAVHEERLRRLAPRWGVYRTRNETTT